MIHSSKIKYIYDGFFLMRNKFFDEGNTSNFAHVYTMVVFVFSLYKQNEKSNIKVTRVIELKER